MKMGVVFLALSAAMPCQAWAYDDKDVIDYRQHIMKSLDEQTAIIGQIVSTLAPPDQMQEHLQQISLMAGIALKSFESKVQGGESKPEVWAEWDDFSKKMNEFASRTAKLTEDAKTGGVQTVTERLAEALTCKECHDKYRIKK